MEPKRKKEKINDKMKARAEAITLNRQINAQIRERIDFMEMEMRLPKVRRRYLKFVIRETHKREVIMNTPKALRWIKWLEYFFMARSKRIEISREIILKEK